MPADDWKEIIADGEAQRFEEHAAVLAALQAKQGGSRRALHAKANAGAEGEFEVPADVPADARIGMFAKPGRFPAIVRYSNGAGRLQSDKKLDVRGFAVKLFGVDGTKVIPGLAAATTQDFLAIRTASVPMRDAEEFMAIVRASATPALLPFRLIRALGLRRGVRVIRSALAGLKAPQSALAATSFYSALPVKFGPHAVQYAFVAREPAAKVTIDGDTGLGDALAARLRERPIVYDFQIRFYADAASTPIEDASVDWNTPWVTIGKLTLPVQDMASPRGKRITDLVERASFDPWHAREDLRPLGNIMRARNVAYRASTQARKAISELEIAMPE
jgi:hypothetical protein